MRRYIVRCCVHDPVTPLDLDDAETFVGSGKCFGFFEGDVMLVGSFDGIK